MPIVRTSLCTEIFKGTDKQDRVALHCLDGKEFLSWHNLFEISNGTLSASEIYQNMIMSVFFL